MSSIMRARSGLMGRGEPSEVMGALPSRRLLDLQCSGSDALTVTRYSASPLRNCADRDAAPLPRAGSFSGALQSVADHAAYGRRCPLRDLPGGLRDRLSWVVSGPCPAP